MGTGYVRQDTSNNIDPNKVARAEDIDLELDAIEDAFNSSTGHTHDGTSAEGAPIEVTGPAQEYLFDAVAIFPKTDDVYDIGKVGAEFRNLYIDGTAFLDAVDIDGGVIDGVSIGSNAAGAGAFTTLSASGVVTLNLGTIVSSGDLPVSAGGTGASTTAAARSNLGLEIGTDVQAAAGQLDQIVAIPRNDGQFIVGTGGTWVGESGATARNSLGLGSMATQNSGTVNISGGTITGITDLAVVDGGTGASTQAGARANLGVSIGSDVQAWYSVLDTIGVNSGVDTTEIVDGAITYVKLNNSILTGADLQLVTGTAGVSGNIAQWNADGDLVNGYSVQTNLTDTDASIPTSGAVIGYGSNIAIFREQQTSGTDGGTFNSGAWQTRTLNNTVVNGISGASLSSNQITLPAGTYKVEASAPGLRVNQHQARLFNVTDAATALVGTSELSDQAGSIVSSRSVIKGTLVLATPKTFRLEHRCLTGWGTVGFGQASGFGEIEVYSVVDIRKIA